MTNSERLAKLRKKRKEEKQSSSSTTNNKTYKNSDRLKKLRLERDIDFNTFESDLKSMGTTVQGIANDWQTKDTMNQTKFSVQAMQRRLNAYQEYQKMYGGADLSELANSYDTVLKGWDERADLYGKFKNADAYNVEKKKVELSNKFRVKTGTDKKTGEDTYRGLTYDEVQKKLKKYKPDSDEYKFLSSYLGYTDLKDFDKAIENTKPLEYPEWYKNAKEVYDNWEIPNVGELNKEETLRLKHQVNYTAHDVEAAKKAREDYFKQVSGGKTLQEFEEEFKKSQENSYLEELKRQRNQRALDHSFELYEDYTNVKDFEKLSQYWDGHTWATKDFNSAHSAASEDHVIT